jgi:hypothetical protein
VFMKMNTETNVGRYVTQTHLEILHRESTLVYFSTRFKFDCNVAYFSPIVSLALAVGLPPPTIFKKKGRGKEGP